MYLSLCRLSNGFKRGSNNSEGDDKRLLLVTVCPRWSYYFVTDLTSVTSETKQISLYRTLFRF